MFGMFGFLYFYHYQNIHVSQLRLKRILFTYFYSFVRLRFMYTTKYSENIAQVYRY
jgi:hypothetical protein